MPEGRLRLVDGDGRPCDLAAVGGKDGDLILLLPRHGHGSRIEGSPARLDTVRRHQLRLVEKVFRRIGVGHFKPHGAERLVGIVLELRQDGLAVGAGVLGPAVDISCLIKT